MNVITTDTGLLDPIDERLGRRLQQIARTEGPQQALTALHGLAGTGVLLAGPSGHVLAPRDLADSANRVRAAGVLRDRAAATETDLTTWVIEAFGLAALRQPETDGSAGPAEYRTLVAALAWLRLGLSGRLLDETLAHLGGRMVGDTPLLRQQLVKGALADVVIFQLDAETSLVYQTNNPPSDLNASVAALVDVHALLTKTDRILQRLLGAKGFAVVGPGQVANVSELLADAYLTSSNSGVCA